MQQVAILLAVSALGVDWGVQRQDDGQLEYVIQIEPSLLDALKSGESITSRVDPRVVNVRRFRIQVGTGELPRDLPVAENESERTSPDGSAYRDPSPLDAGAIHDEADLTSSDPYESPHIPRAEAADFAPMAEQQMTDHHSDQPPKLLPLDTPGGFGEADVHEARFDRSTPGVRAEYDSSADRGQRLRAPPSFDVADRFDPPRKEVIAPPIEDYAPDTSVPSDSRFASGEPSMDPDRVVEPALGAAAAHVVSSDARSQRSQPSSGTVTSPTNVAQPTPAESTSPTPSTRPWLPLMVTVLALFASVGLNLYLGWIALVTYNRFRELVADVHHAGPGAVTL